MLSRTVIDLDDSGEEGCSSKAIVVVSPIKDPSRTPLRRLEVPGAARQLSAWQPTRQSVASPSPAKEVKITDFCVPLRSLQECSSSASNPILVDDGDTSEDHSSVSSESSLSSFSFPELGSTQKRTARSLSLHPRSTIGHPPPLPKETAETTAAAPPFHLDNLVVMVDTVAHEGNAHLFSATQLELLGAFQLLPRALQLLTAYLWRRKPRWLPIELVHQRIQRWLPPEHACCEGLLAAVGSQAAGLSRFVHLLASADALQGEDLAVLLQDQTAKTLTEMCFQLKLSTRGMGRRQLIQTLQAHSRLIQRQVAISSFFSPSKLSSSSSSSPSSSSSLPFSTSLSTSLSTSPPTVSSLALNALHSTRLVRLSRLCKDTFDFVQMLFTVHFPPSEPDDAYAKFSSAAALPDVLLLSSLRSQSFACYPYVSDYRAIFPDRDYLERYVAALELEATLYAALQAASPDLEKLLLQIDAFEVRTRALDEQDPRHRVASLVAHRLQAAAAAPLEASPLEHALRQCKEEALSEYREVYIQAYISVGAVLTRSLWHSIEHLERQKLHAKANGLLELMLSTPYTPHRRGKWWNRLALNTQAHLGRKADALEICERGLRDPWVHFGPRIALQERLTRLCKPPLRHVAVRFPDYSCAVPEEHFSGTLVSKQLGSKNRFEAPLGDGTSCSVEDLCLQLYATEMHGGWSGSHCEGSIVRALCGLLLWDAIFEGQSDQGTPQRRFVSPFQDGPLDLGCPWLFYLERSAKITALLAEVAGHRDQPDWICTHIGSLWAQRQGQMCRWIPWEKVTLEELVAVGGGLGCQVLSQFIEKLASDPLSLSSGMPDLLLWKTLEDGRMRAKFVEVKGPN
ncbi:MAG: fanconi-associated nuclease 1, partial [archaeon]|nr:fanconi-associated nuclease 1 [archaeon]